MSKKIKSDSKHVFSFIFDGDKFISVDRGLPAEAPWELKPPYEDEKLAVLFTRPNDDVQFQPERNQFGETDETTIFVFQPDSGASFIVVNGQKFEVLRTGDTISVNHV